MRLIDAGELMEKIVEYDNENIQSPNREVIVDVIDAISEMIVEQPTAYDIDKTVEQLKAQCGKSVTMGRLNGKTLTCGFYLGILKAIEIVKKGGNV